MTTVISDTFTDTNGTALSAHNPDVGTAASWVRHSASTGANSTAIQTNQLTMGTGSSPVEWWTNSTTLSGSDYIVTVDCILNTSISGVACENGPTGRWDATAKTGYLFELAGGATQNFNLYKFQAGAQVALATAVPIATSSGQTYRLELNISTSGGNAVITGRYSTNGGSTWTTAFNVTDNGTINGAVIASGRPGFLMYSDVLLTSACSFDNYLVTQVSAASLTSVTGNAGDGTIVAAAVAQRVNFVGSGTSWVSAPTITPSSGSLGAITVDSTTTAHANFTPTTTPGVITFTDTTDSSTTATLTTITLVTALAAFTGPSTGVISVASTNFTVAFPASRADTAAVIITPASSLAGTFSPTTVTLAANTTAPSATFTFTPTVIGAHSISITNNGSLTNTGSPLTYTVSSSSPGTVGDANIDYSPGNIRVQGSAYWETISPGAFWEFEIDGTTDPDLAVQVDLTPAVQLTISAANRPIISWFVGTTAGSDFSAPTVHAFQTDTLDGANKCSLVLARSLAAGKHHVRLWVQGISSGAANDDRWTGNTGSANSPGTALRVVQFTRADASTVVGTTYTATVGSALSVTYANPYARTDNAYFFGDSITQALNDVSGVTNFFGWPQAVADACNAKPSVIGFGQQGWSSGPPVATNIPAFHIVSGASTWDKFSGSFSRLSGGLFIGSPKYIFLNHGTNGDPTQAEAQDWLTKVRTAAPTAYIFVLVPFGGFSRSILAAAVTAQADAKVHLIDPGATKPDVVAVAASNGKFEHQLGISKDASAITLRSTESAAVHPSAQALISLAARTASQVGQVLFGAGGGSGGGRRRFQ